MRRETILILVTIAVSACSMVYELLLAQCLATLYGNTVMRYSITIGLYLFALGMGAIAFPRLGGRGPVATLLLKIELALALCGACSPLFVFGAEAMAVRGGAAWPTFAVVHLWIFLIGFLSGLEVPALLGVAAEIGTRHERRVAAVLGADFVGTCLGAVLFPLLLYPLLGIIATAALVGLVNLVSALLVLAAAGLSPRPRLLVATTLAGGALLLLWTYEAPVRALVGRLVFGIEIA